MYIPTGLRNKCVIDCALVQYSTPYMPSWLRCSGMYQTVISRQPHLRKVYYFGNNHHILCQLPIYSHQKIQSKVWYLYSMHYKVHRVNSESLQKVTICQNLSVPKFSMLTETLIDYHIKVQVLGVFPKFLRTCFQGVFNEQKTSIFFREGRLFATLLGLSEIYSTRNINSEHWGNLEVQHLLPEGAEFFKCNMHHISSIEFRPSCTCQSKAKIDVVLR